MEAETKQVMNTVNIKLDTLNPIQVSLLRSACQYILEQTHEPSTTGIKNGHIQKNGI